MAIDAGGANSAHRVQGIRHERRVWRGGHGSHNERVRRHRRVPVVASSRHGQAGRTGCRARRADSRPRRADGGGLRDAATGRRSAEAEW